MSKSSCLSKVFRKDSFLQKPFLEINNAEIIKLLHFSIGPITFHAVTSQLTHQSIKFKFKFKTIKFNI